MAGLSISTAAHSLHCFAFSSVPSDSALAKRKPRDGLFPHHTSSWTRGTHKGRVDGIHEFFLIHADQLCSMLMGCGPDQGTQGIGELCQKKSLSLVWWHMPTCNHTRQRQRVSGQPGDSSERQRKARKTCSLNIVVFKQWKLGEGSSAFLEQSPLNQAEKK